MAGYIERDGIQSKTCRPSFSRHSSFRRRRRRHRHQLSSLVVWLVVHSPSSLVIPNPGAIITSRVDTHHIKEVCSRLNILGLERRAASSSANDAAIIKTTVASHKLIRLNPQQVWQKGFDGLASREFQLLQIDYPCSFDVFFWLLHSILFP